MIIYFVQKLKPSNEAQNLPLKKKMIITHFLEINFIK